MKYITERSEIARTINLGKKPVVYVEDISACRTDYGWQLGKIKITANSGFITADLYIFRDEKKLVTCSYGACIKSDFGWHDIAEMATNANLPIIEPNSTFVLVIGKKEAGQCSARKGLVMAINTGKAQLGTDEPLVIGEDMRGMLIAMDENIDRKS